MKWQLPDSKEHGHHDIRCSWTLVCVRFPRDNIQSSLDNWKKNTWLLGLPANTASHVTACFSGIASWPSLEPSNSRTPITYVSWRMAKVRQLKKWMWVLIYLSKHFIVQPWWLSSGHCFAQASIKLFPTCISWRRTQTITYYYCTNFYPWDVHQWVGWASSKAQEHLWLCTILGTCFFWWPLRRGQGATP